jgi:hypothetical protein
MGRAVFWPYNSIKGSVTNENDCVLSPTPFLLTQPTKY